MSSPPTPEPITIRKVVVTKFSSDPSESLTIVTTTLPPPPASHVQVQVLYSGFSGADVAMARGIYPMQRPAPLTPGYCMVGRVVCAGPRSSGLPNTDWEQGTLVTALTVYDSEAERVNIPERYLIRVHEGIEPAVATALTLDWNTAYGMVEHAACVRPGHGIFVHGLSGAVGYAVATLCLLRGASVFGTASDRNHESLVGLGVTPFVYTNKGWIDAMQAQGGVDAVFDPLGFQSWEESYSILATTRPSVLVGYGGNQNLLPSSSSQSEKESGKVGVVVDQRKLPSQVPQIVKLVAKNLKRFIGDNRRTIFYYIERDHKDFRPDLETLMDLCRTGKITVPIKAKWNLDQVRDAHRGWGKKEGMGSMVIKCSE
ncbi:uncharacterized protein PgNI_00055 [Pyricularia grisea]|uniref:Enoyl reductase (ER) domain-containing protein n=1 Tax=Pyricularia grisea TaxID=148305 RepID=A0A6P8BGR9_PYRGI|nr:uncharacterized protein PgNI_00055 [Pyricularia grisea]TLD15973.1 hypothetical protein PgNI_00055 [Pyricularia grisea]